MNDDTERRSVGFVGGPSEIPVCRITVASVGPGRSTGELCLEFHKFLAQTVDFTLTAGTARGGRGGTILVRAVVLMGIAARAIIWTSLRVVTIRCRGLPRTIRLLLLTELCHSAASKKAVFEGDCNTGLDTRPNSSVG